MRASLIRNSSFSIGISARALSSLARHRAVAIRELAAEAPCGQDSGPAKRNDVGDTRAHVSGPRLGQWNLGKVLAHESLVDYKDRAVEPFLQPGGIPC